MIGNFFLIFLITFRKTLFHFISSNFLVQSPRSDKTMEADLRAFLYGAPICLLFYLTFTKEFISYLDSCYQICYNNTKSTVKNITKYAQYIEEQCCTEKLGTQDDCHACSSNHWSTMWAQGCRNQEAGGGGHGIANSGRPFHPISTRRQIMPPWIFRPSYGPGTTMRK